MSVTVVAVDFGASSIRVCRVELGDGPPRVEVVHRTRTRRVHDARGVLRWDWDRLRRGARTRARASRSTIGPVASIGIDTWGVDYGLLDAARRAARATRSRIATRAPTAYRDGGRADRRAPASTSSPGCRPSPINTIFQLAAHDPDQLARAAHVVMLPELARRTTSPARSSPRPRARAPPGCSTSPPGTGRPSSCDAIALAPRRCCPRIHPAGTRVGRVARRPRAPRRRPRHRVRGARRRRAGRGVRVRRHVAARRPRAAGARTPASPRFAAGFSNEQGALGGVRLLRNVAGLVARRGVPPHVGRRRPRRAPRRRRRGARTPASLVDATDERFLAPSDMAASSRSAPDFGRRREPRHRRAHRGRVDGGRDRRRSSRRCPVDDASRPVRAIRVFGGGSRSPLLSRRAPPAHRTAGRRSARSRRPRSGTRSPRALALGCLRGRATRRVRHWPTRRRSRDERPGTRTARAHAPPPRHRRPRPGRRSSPTSSTSAR